MSGLKVEYKKIKELIPYCNNSRTHSDEQVLQIASSIKEFGFTNPVLIDGQGGIIAGHGRIMAAQKLKMDEVPTITLSDLSEAQKKAYIIADNKLALNSGWDDELLKIELEQLKELDFDLGLIGFSDDELALLMGGETTEGLVDEDQVPELVDDPVTVLGDVWLLGEHRLMCGNSTAVTDVDRLMMGAKADMVFTDPPYGVDYDGGHFHSGNVNIKRKRERLAGDATTQIYTDVIPVLAAYCNGPCYTWFAGTKPIDLFNAVDMVGEIHAMIVWHKTNATYAAMNAQYKQRHEPCLYWKPKGKTLMWCGASTEATIWEMKKDGKNNFHPTQKPVELAARAIGNHTAKTVLDLFGGSGSTLIACEQTGRKCYMMELNPSYVDVIIKRWQDFTGKQATLESNGKTYNELLNDNQTKNTH